MRVNIAYGKGRLTVEVPKTSQVLDGKNVSPVSNLAEEIKQLLLRPIGTENLASIIAKKNAQTACIVVSDHTRPVPNTIILPPLLAELAKQGLAKENITILLANGMHRKTTTPEKIELLGKELVDQYTVIDHDARDTNSLLYFQVQGIPVSVNRVYCQADLKILTGFIEPHFMAGFSGGRKALCPGISGLDTIKYFHSPALLESPFANPGNLVDNPCHEFAVAVAKTVGVDAILNVTLNREKKITGVFWGQLEEAHQKGTAACESQTTCYVNAPFDIVITTNGGYPLDRDFYQTVKGLVGALEIVRENRLIICAVECCDGIGSPEFKNLLFNMHDPKSFLQMIAQPGYFCVDQWEVEELVKVLKKVRVKLYSTGLNEVEIRRCHVEPISSIEIGISQGLKEFGNDARIAVIPDGPYTLTKLKSSPKS